MLHGYLKKKTCILWLFDRVACVSSLAGGLVSRSQTLVNLSVLPALSEFALRALKLCCLARTALGLLNPLSRVMLADVSLARASSSSFQSYHTGSLHTVGAFLEICEMVGPLLPECCGFQWEVCFVLRTIASLLVAANWNLRGFEIFIFRSPKLLLVFLVDVDFFRLFCKRLPWSL